MCEQRLMPFDCTTPNFPLRGLGGLGGGWWRALHQAQNASYPPVAGHDHPADHPAASVVVGPHVGPPQGFADPLAVGVAAAALGAAHALVVQHGVDVHAAPLALQASLGRHGERASVRAFRGGFLTDVGGGGCCQMGFLIVRCFLLQCCVGVYSPSPVDRSVQQRTGD